MEQKSKENICGAALLGMTALFFAGCCCRSHTTATEKETDNAITLSTQIVAAAPMLPKQAKAGEIIKACSQLFVISDIIKVKVVTPPPEAYRRHIGQPVRVHIAAFDQAVSV